MFIHCHNPIGAVIGRLAGHSTGTKVIYTAHGFHFYDGAPLTNWLLYYPVEKWLSKYTDTIITINKEDYKRAKDKFYAKNVKYIPRIGVDTKRFEDKHAGSEIRKDLGINPNDVLLFVPQIIRNGLIEAALYPKRTTFDYIRNY